jgi:Periplasmic copper-binding protein (NosD)
MRRLWISLPLLALLAIASIGTALAAPPPIVVQPSHLNGWVATSTAGGNSAFIADGTAPSGNGALQLTTDNTNPAKVNYSHGLSAPVALPSVTELSYYTERNSGPAVGAPSYQLPVFLEGSNTEFTTLVFEPYWNNPGPAVGTAPAAWTKWDVDAGWFWSSQTHVCAGGTVTAGAGGPPLYHLSDIETLCPGTVALGFGVQVGSFNPSYDVEVDLVSFNSQAYDFEPETPCTTVCYADAVNGNDSFGGGSLTSAKKTIQAAIDAVSPGGSVLVNDGTYNESPNITKSLTLQSINGRGVTNIQLQTGPTYLGALTVGGSNVTVNGFTVIGRDGTPSVIAASDILLNSGLNNVVIENNKLEVGEVDPGSTNGDDGFGLLTTYTTTPAAFVASLNVHDNLFVPLSSIGHRAYYINPGVDSFTFQNNTITGNFVRYSWTQAKNGLVANNVLTGNGSSDGFGATGAPDPTLYGATTFSGNTISNVDTGIWIDETNNVTVTHNKITSSANAVRVTDEGDFPGQYDPTTVSITRNNLAVGAANNGIEGSTLSSSVDGTCNWWGNVSGPGAIASGTGSLVTANVNYTPWLQSSDLDSSCSAGGNITIILDAHPDGSQPFSFTGTNGIAPFTLIDDGSSSNTKTFTEPAGLYVFRVGALPKWALIKLTCDTHETILKPHRLVQIQLQPDQNVTCTFTESYRIPDAMIALTSGGPYSGDNIYSGAVLPSQTLTQSFAAGDTKSFFVRFQNDGLDTDTYRVASKLKGSLKYSVLFMIGNVEITGKVLADTYSFSLAPGATRTIEIRVTAGAISPSDLRRIILTLQSKTAPAAVDTVKAVVNGGV